MLTSDLYTYMVRHAYAHTLSFITIIMLMMTMLIIIMIIMEFLARLGDTRPQSQHTNAVDEEVDMLWFKPRTSMSSKALSVWQPDTGSEV